MKYLPIIAVSIASLTLAACAIPPSSEYAPIGKTAKAPQVVAQCIAKTWADATQLPVTSQTVIAHDKGIDILVPGQPVGGAAAAVRPLANGGSWVSYRRVANQGPDDATTSTIKSCM